jgi:radical SAM protein with 4Fe4S-binding SPASM domain
MKRLGAVYHDGFRLMRSFTIRRLIHLAWLQLTYLIARIFKVFLPTSGPVSVSVEPTTSCNLRCPECPSGLRQFSRPTGKVDLKAFTHWVDQLGRTAMWLNLYFQGEPMLHPAFGEMIRIAKSRRFYVMTSTNGHFLTDAHCQQMIGAGLDRLVVSVDGLDQQSYEQYRQGGNLETVIQGIERLCRMKVALGVRHPYLVIQFLVLRSNEHQIPEVESWFQRPGIDEIQLKSAQFYGYETGNPLIPFTTKYSRYRKNSSSGYAIKSRLPNFCKRLWFGAVVTWDGKVVPCCYDKDGSYVMGNLQEEPIGTIWKKRKYKAFREGVFTKRHKIPICTNCSEGLK